MYLFKNHSEPFTSFEGRLREESQPDLARRKIDCSWIFMAKPFALLKVTNEARLDIGIFIKKSKWHSNCFY